MTQDMTLNTTRRWLLVDDDADNLKMLSLVLRRVTGAPVECHPTAESALAAFSADPGRYGPVITDLQMPGMNGVELCRQMHSIAPGQKIILATGSGGFNETTARREGFVALLNKPFPMTVLRRALANAGFEPAFSGAA
jgi:CheY-like chemotaxis protein